LNCLGFDCDGDGLPESIELFKETSETSCCRLVDLPGVTPRGKPVERVLSSSDSSRDTSRDESRDPVAAPKPEAKPLAPPKLFDNLFGGKKK
jgi:hypothetical protein